MSSHTDTELDYEAKEGEQKMSTAMTVICCLIPCIGMALGLMLIQKAKKKKADDAASGPSNAVVSAAGVRILITAAVLLVVTVLVLAFVPAATPKARLVTAILVVTMQYAAAMVLIFGISGMLHKDRKNRTQTEKKEKK